MARSCVFCDGTPVSREHVWPRWARTIWAEEGHMPHFQQVVQDDRDDVERNWRGEACSMTVTAVCQRCNNGWMSDLEQDAKPMLEAMLDGRGRLLHAGGQRTLAAWALKTAMMAGHTNGAARHVIGAEQYEHLMERLAPSNRVVIWMASYAGDVTAMCRMYGLDADMDAGPDPNRGARDIWGTTIAFGPVVFQLFGSDIPELVAGAQVRAPGCHQLWPYVGSFTWAPRPALNDYGLVGFADGLLREARRIGRASVGSTPATQ
jgi:hypothetical protein